MNDELKIILEDIDNKERYYVGTNGCLYQDLTKEELLLIKDYISNLQQENERLTQGVTILTNKLIDMTKAKENYKLKGDDENEK